VALDLTQFHGTFFDESFEALDGMEAALLALDVGAPDADRINTIFRCAHSIKGGSGMFAFDEVTSFAHSLETLLDELRGKGMQVTTAIADLLLKSVDVMRELLRGRQSNLPHDAQRVADLKVALERTIAGSAGAPAAAEPDSRNDLTAAPSVAALHAAMQHEAGSGPIVAAAPITAAPLRGASEDIPSKATVAPTQVLTFTLGAETYGVDILSVQEIRGWTPVTAIPYAPPHVLGVLNLRGSIIPVVDLRVRFALEKAEYGAVTVIVVLSVISGSTRRNFGVVVDSVSDVIDVDPAQVHPAPDLGTPAATDHVLGLLPIADRMVVLLDIAKLIGLDLTDARVVAAEAAARDHRESAALKASRQ
jgi:chemotaxis signal transduction protein/HPt (histidine-containing phosphotransfer) domain-containing protein